MAVVAETYRANQFDNPQKITAGSPDCTVKCPLFISGSRLRAGSVEPGVGDVGGD